MQMTGWKTWAAGLGAIAAGLGNILRAVDFETWSVNGEAMNEAIALIVFGLGMIGVGHKVEKSNPMKN